MSQDIQLQLVYAAVASLADDADHDLALAILARLVMPSRDQLSDPADETLINASGPWSGPTENLEQGPHGWGHEADWCRDCQEGCGEAYGGACHCCKHAARCEEDEI